MKGRTTNSLTSTSSKRKSTKFKDQGVKSRDLRDSIFVEAKKGESMYGIAKKLGTVRGNVQYHLEQMGFDSHGRALLKQKAIVRKGLVARIKTERGLVFTDDGRTMVDNRRFAAGGACNGNTRIEISYVDAQTGIQATGNHQCPNGRCVDGLVSKV